MEHIKSIVQNIIQSAQEKGRDEIGYAQEIWKKITDKTITQSTSARYYKNGVLYVDVKNPAWKFELSVKKEIILKKINKYSKKKIKDIRFKVGDINGQKKRTK